MEMRHWNIFMEMYYVFSESETIYYGSSYRQIIKIRLIYLWPIGTSFEVSGSGHKSSIQFTKSVRQRPKQATLPVASQIGLSHSSKETTAMAVVQRLI